MFAEARRTEIGNWEVFCVDCRDSVGTMTGRIFQRAMIFGLSRGGVKCPDCRKKSCPRCQYWNEEGTLCAICRWEVKEEKKTLSIVSAS